MWMNINFPIGGFSLSLDASLYSDVINLAVVHVPAVCEAAEQLKHDAVCRNTLR